MIKTRKHEMSNVSTNFERNLCLSFMAVSLLFVTGCASVSNLDPSVCSLPDMSDVGSIDNVEVLSYLVLISELQQTCR